MKILIVKDNIDIVESLQAAFEDHECKLAFSGKQGSEILALERFDIVITDINMPGGGGERIIVEARSKHNIPVFVYTGADKPEVLYENLGAKAVFRKPNAIDLIEAVEKELDNLVIRSHKNFR